MTRQEMLASFSQPAQERRIMAVWERFLQSGEVAPNAVRHLIEDSWWRCWTAGIDPSPGRFMQAGLARMGHSSRSTVVASHGTSWRVSSSAMSRERSAGRGATLRSSSDISRHQRLQDNNDEFVTPKAMLAELCTDNQQLTRSLRSTHEVCEQHHDVATARLMENWIDETERRAWFLSEITRDL
jgi:hypothetical protein